MDLKSVSTDTLARELARRLGLSGQNTQNTQDVSTQGIIPEMAWELTRLTDHCS